jgi:hypothetical protein
LQARPTVWVASLALQVGPVVGILSTASMTSL